MMRLSSFVLQNERAATFVASANGALSALLPAGNKGTADGVGGLSYPVTATNVSYEVPADSAAVSADASIDVSMMADAAAVADAVADAFAENAELFKPKLLLSHTYTVKSGDMVGFLAQEFGLNQSTIISMNKIKNTRVLQIGQKLRVPNQDGIIYTAVAGDTAESIAEKNKISTADLRYVNNLFSGAIKEGAVVFIPGVELDQTALQEINGDLFMWPARGAITSYYGMRVDPFNRGRRQFHTGLDIGVRSGTSVKAAMSGRVVTISYNDVYGNYIIIAHHSNYRTLYAHLSSVKVKSGSYVGTGQVIAASGATGLVTGPHLHFTVFKNGALVNPRVLMN
jgi:murein DD-endopeptidase MepM/ murein hydrolase activator NlpD